MNTHWTDDLKKLRACQQAIEFCRGYNSIDEAWAACQNSEWMFWYIAKLSGKPGSPARLLMLKALVECLEYAFSKISVDSSDAQKCLNVIKAYCTGNANIAEVRQAAAYANAAAYAADAAADAYAAAAAYAAYAAANAAAYAAYAAANAAANAAAYAAYAAANAAANAGIIRKYYPLPPSPTPA